MNCLGIFNKNSSCVFYFKSTACNRSVIATIPKEVDKNYVIRKTPQTMQLGKPSWISVYCAPSISQTWLGFPAVLNSASTRRGLSALSASENQAGSKRWVYVCFPPDSCLPDSPTAASCSQQPLPGVQEEYSLTSRFRSHCFPVLAIFKAGIPAICTASLNFSSCLTWHQSHTDGALAGTSYEHEEGLLPICPHVPSLG